MIDRDRALRLIAAREAQRERSALDRLAATLRQRFENHPKQRAFWQSTSEDRRDAALTTRRAGKSDGGVHEWTATALTTPGWRGVYVNETLPEARKIVWRNDMGQGFCDLLAQHGQSLGNNTYRLATITAKVNDTAAEINFSNGSQIALFGADDEASINKMRGQAKDAIWCDEAQKFKHLRAFILQVASPCVKDKRGRIKLTGTPSEDAAGYFYDVTCEPDSGDTPLKGWSVHRWSVADNPWFGATPEERWARTAGEALAENGWDGTEPEFVREWLGKWVKGDARYVYPVHAAPGHIQLCYAPQRLVPNPINGSHAPWIDITAALRDLPSPPPRHKPFTWLYAIGADFGYAQDPFAITVWASTPVLPEIYELWSWKQHRVVPDDQAAYLKALWDRLDNVIVLVGDPAGQVAANMAGWRERMGLPIDEAEKSSKPTWQAMMAGDIRKGRVRYREGSPLLTEHKHLVYLPTKPGKPLKDHADRRSSDGKVHGNHCFVAGTMVETLYGPRPIEQMAPGDLVHTRAGIRLVTSACSTGVHPTLEVSFEDGRVLRGTAEHPIATPSGWVPLAELAPGDTVLGWANTDAPRASSSTAEPIGDTPTPSTGPRASTSRALSSEEASPDRSCYTEPSGNLSTVPSQMGITSTTRTATRSTTRSATSSASPGRIISASMPQHLSELRDLAPAWAQHALLPPSGMDPTKAGPGMPSMAATSWPLDRSCRARASSVAPGSSPRTRTPSSAAGSVGQPSDETVVSTTSCARAPSVSPHSAVRGSASRPVVRVRVASVRATGLAEETFDLSVEGEHEFLANRVITANCADAALYSFRHLTHYMATGAVSRPAPGTSEAYAAEEERLERKVDELERKREARYAAMDDNDEDAGLYREQGYQWD